MKMEIQEGLRGKDDARLVFTSHGNPPVIVVCYTSSGKCLVVGSENQELSPRQRQARSQAEAGMKRYMAEIAKVTASQKYG